MAHLRHLGHLHRRSRRPILVPPHRSHEDASPQRRPRHSLPPRPTTLPLLRPFRPFWSRLSLHPYRSMQVRTCSSPSAGCHWRLVRQCLSVPVRVSPSRPFGPASDSGGTQGITVSETQSAAFTNEHQPSGLRCPIPSRVSPKDTSSIAQASAAWVKHVPHPPALTGRSEDIGCRVSSSHSHSRFHRPGFQPFASWGGRVSPARRAGLW